MKTEPKSVRKGEIANVDTVEVVDAYTVKLNLKQPGRRPAGHADRPGRHDGLAQGRPGARRRSSSATPRVRAPGPFEFVEWVKDDHLLHQAQRRLLEQAGRPVPRPHPLPADPRRHGQAAEPAGGRDRRDGLRRSRATWPRSRRTRTSSWSTCRRWPTFAYQLNHTKPPFDNKALRQAVAYALDLEADRQGRLARRRRAGQRADPAVELGLRQARSRRSSATSPRPRRSWPRAASRTASPSRSRPTTSRSTSRKPR